MNRVVRSSKSLSVLRVPDLEAAGGVILYECSQSPLNPLEKLNGLECWSPSWSGLEFQGVPKRGEKSPHHEIATQQFLPVVVIWGTCEFSDSGHGYLQVLCFRLFVPTMSKPQYEQKLANYAQQMNTEGIEPQ